MRTLHCAGCRSPLPPTRTDRYCQACRNAYARAYHSAHKDARNARRRELSAWRTKDAARTQERQRRRLLGGPLSTYERRAERRAYRRHRAVLCRRRETRQHRVWRRRHPEQCRVITRRYELKRKQVARVEASLAPQATLQVAHDAGSSTRRARWLVFGEGPKPLYVSTESAADAYAWIREHGYHTEEDGT